MEIDPERVRLLRTLADYRADRVRLADGNLAEATHVVATRNGLLLVSPAGWRVLMHGQFFGLTLDEGDLLAFEACGRPSDHSENGRILRLRRVGDTFAVGEVLARGLDNGCHGMDFAGGRLHLLDTYRQRVLALHADGSGLEVVEPFEVVRGGRFTPDDPRYLHANSLLSVGETILVLLHRRWVQTGLPSELAVFDRRWNPLGRYPVDARGAHDLAVWPDGSVLLCDSLRGALVSTGGLRREVSALMTRGLAVGEDGVAVGGSALAGQAERLRSRGTITFFDRELQKCTVLELPGAPTCIRRLDGRDRGLSRWLETQGQDGSMLRLESPSQADET